MIGATPGALLPAPITALAFPVCMFVGGPGGPTAGRCHIGWVGRVLRVHRPPPQNTVGKCSWITHRIYAFLGGGWKKVCFIFIPIMVPNDPIWRACFFQMDWFSGAKVVRGFTGIHWVSSEGGGVGSQVVVVEDPWDEQLYFYSMNGWSVQ